MKKELKIGDRVRFVGAAGIPAFFSYTGTDAVISDSLWAGFNLQIAFTWLGRSQTGSIHPRQITHRLVKKKKPPSVLVTRESLAKVWTQHFSYPPLEKSSIFNAFCESLGLPEQKEEK